MDRKVKTIVGVAVLSLLGGIVAGYVIAHWTMGEMSGMGMEKVDAPGSAERTDAMKDMKQTDMNGMAMESTRPMKDMAPMPGMSAMPSEVITIPAGTRQLIGVRSAPVIHAMLEQEIRTVGRIDYDERGFSQVTLKIPGWVRTVFVDSIGRPVSKGERLFTLYSPDLLTSQDEYLLAIKTQAQVAASPLEDAKANAVALVTSTRERLRLWDVTDAQIAALERRGKAEPVLTVYAPSSGILLKREAIKLSRRSQDALEVLEGLEVEDRIVTSANFLLDAESKLVSSSSMQSMMRRIGMADCQMREAYEAKMEAMDMGSMRGMEGHQGMMSMEGMSGMKGMDNMSGMEMERMKDMERMKGMEDMSGMPDMTSGSAKAVFETRKVGRYMLVFTTVPETPKAGEVLLKLKVTDQTGKPVTDARVTFVYTMPMPGMADSKVAASHTKDGIYEGKAKFGMGGTWVVTANVTTIPGKPPITERFQFMVAGEGM